MTYEQRFDLDLCDFAGSLEAEETFMYEAGIPGMRPLDYEPDMNDYEYMQSILY